MFPSVSCHIVLVLCCGLILLRVSVVVLGIVLCVVRKRSRIPLAIFALGIVHIRTCLSLEWILCVSASVSSSIRVVVVLLVLVQSLVLVGRVVCGVVCPFGSVSRSGGIRVVLVLSALQCRGLGMRCVFLFALFGWCVGTCTSRSLTCRCVLAIRRLVVLFE